MLDLVEILMYPVNLKILWKEVDTLGFTNYNEY